MGGESGDEREKQLRWRKESAAEKGDRGRKNDLVVVVVVLNLDLDKY